MADMNRWTRTLERRTLEGLAAEVTVLRAAAKDSYGQRRMATRILQLIEDKLLALREADERAESRSEDDIAEELKA